MTDQEINIAIAGACGWYDVKVRPGHWVRILKPRGRKNGYTFKYPRAIPDYCRDLNAMHEAESAIPIGDEGYWDELIRVVERDYGSLATSPVVGRATARQRAEAFLRTKGLWKP